MNHQLSYNQYFGPAGPDAQTLSPEIPGLPCGPETKEVMNLEEIFSVLNIVTVRFSNSHFLSTLGDAILCLFANLSIDSWNRISDN